MPAEVRVERPRNRDHGDWSTNVALQLAKGAGIPPRDLAVALASTSTASTGSRPSTSRAPGSSTSPWTPRAPASWPARSSRPAPTYGHSTAEAGRVVNLEFISANPTGPLHIGHTRWAALGDAMRRLLTAAGAQVAAEYYINDAGAQMDKFGASVLARAAGQEPPEDGYPGEYVADRAAEVLAQRPDLLELPARRGLRRRPRPRLHRPARRHPAHPRRVRRRTSTSGSPSARCTRGTPWSRPSPGCASRATCSTPRAPCGCAPPTSATTRTGSSSAADGEPHLLRRRRRLLPEQEGPRLRREGLPARRRPPRLHQPAQGHRGVRGRRPRAQHRGADRPAHLHRRRSGWASGRATSSSSTS